MRFKCTAPITRMMNCFLQDRANLHESVLQHRTPPHPSLESGRQGWYSLFIFLYFSSLNLSLCILMTGIFSFSLPLSNIASSPSSPSHTHTYYICSVSRCRIASRPWYRWLSETRSRARASPRFRSTLPTAPSTLTWDGWPAGSCPAQPLNR